MIKRKLTLFGAAAAIAMMISVPTFAAESNDTDTKENTQTQSQEMAAEETDADADTEKTEEAEEALEGCVICSVLNVREGDSTEDDKVGTLSKGDMVTILEETENGWYAIEFEDDTCYVCADYVTTDETEIEELTTYSWDGPVLTAFAGTVTGPSGRETYYNLDMSGVISVMRSLGYTDEYWVRDDGVKMLGNYVIVAANLSVHPRGSIVPTSLGLGIVCDTGGFAVSNPNQLDIAVTW